MSKAFDRLSLEEMFNIIPVVTKTIQLSGRYKGSISYDISCPYDNWGVSGEHLPTLFVEAFHYFQQYYDDGVYDEFQY